MAARNRTARNRNARRPMPRVQTDNLARKYNSQELERRLERSGRVDFDRQYYQPREIEADRIARRRAASKAARRPAMTLSPAVALGSIGVAALMVLVLLCHIQLNAISSRIVAMKATISQLETTQVSLQVARDRAFDLSMVKEEAEAAGMAQPSESQIYYLHLPGQDRAVSYSERKANGGFQMVSGFFQQLKEMLAYFAG